ncbi:MAG TPA: ATP-binding cassette domain-containing protein [Candidatus Dormibacteraeota bacterium]|nr:ATP-binding cassette domain-containing protein [Candidatus Dormibacteraeota bacterium]
MTAATAGLEVTGLRAPRDGVLLEVPRLHVARGECAVLAAPGGTGKTLLAAALAGHLAAAGEVRCAGRPCAGSPSRRRRAGLAAVVQGRPRLDGCSVAEALGLAATGSRTAAAAIDLLPALGALAARPARTLSGGEHQLLRIACAWLAVAGALVLDTPTDGLAEPLAAAVRDLARAEAGRGAAVLWLDQPGAVLPAPPSLEIVGAEVRALAGPGTASSRPAGG